MFFNLQFSKPPNSKSSRIVGSSFNWLFQVDSNYY